MASSSATGPDTVINLKVSHDGAIKKLKLPLRDLGANTLESKLRDMLFIPSDTRCVMERYSDSAASYVILDPTNAPVFKQLYRAAKAKQKLKLRVTTIYSSPRAPTPAPAPVAQEPETELESESKPVPRPVTIEDVPEMTDSKPTSSKVEEPAASIAPTVVDADSVPVTSTLSAPAWSIQDMREDLERFAKRARQSREDYMPAETSKSSERVRTELTTLLSSLQARAHTIASLPERQPTASVETPKPAEPVQATTPVNTHPAAPRPPFAVYCNSCDKTIPDIHYHCSTCDDGDFDLCQGCVDMGITCYGDDHWLIKRMIRNGMIVTSTTERKAPAKTLVESPPFMSCSLPRVPVQPPMVGVASISAMPPAVAPQAPAARVVPVFKNYLYQNVRTCNNCVQEFPEHEFVHCTTCFDFDLCKSCFVKDTHGHHPRHGFVPAVEGTVIDAEVSVRLAPGRNQKHNAICDGCDKFIKGVRHKCLDCPDWDYCADCVGNAGFIHPNHRFVPIYDPLRDVSARCSSRQVHFGIHCDGPLCRTVGPRFITGDRYKCAVCHDTDFCANCEASPANTHNKTHPLLKFKTPVRNVNVVTTGEREDGKKMPVMGDRTRHTSTSSRSTETAAPKQQNIAPSRVATVVNVLPVPPAAPKIEVKAEVEQPTEKDEPKQEPPVEVAKPEPLVAAVKEPADVELVAVYERDTIADGTIMPPNHIFEQTWVLRNAGTEAWPAGCSVKYVGGDYMGHVNSNHPAGVKELISASESTICYAPLAPGQTFSFTVLLRTPPRDGKVISYWRLTTPDGLKFGHRLWCDVEVKSPKPEKVEETPIIKEEPKEDIKEEDVRSSQTHESQMIFPKLRMESPVASIDESVETEARDNSTDAADEFLDCNEDDEWDESEDGFMTDEEYDILDASDEEYMSDAQKKQLKK